MSDGRIFSGVMYEYGSTRHWFCRSRHPVTTIADAQALGLGLSAPLLYEKVRVVLGAQGGKPLFSLLQSMAREDPHTS